MRELSRRRWVPAWLAIGVLAAVVALGSGSASSRAGQAAASTAPKYLLAVGDSLAAGYQPIDGVSLPPVDPGSGFRDQGYPGSYAADLRVRGEGSRGDHGDAGN